MNKESKQQPALDEKLMKRLLDHIFNGSKAEIRQAQLEFDKVCEQFRYPHKKEELAAMEMLREKIRDFSDIENIDTQLALVRMAKRLFMALGDEHFEEFSDFIIRAIQHPSGKVRQDILHASSWLLLANDSLLFSEGGRKRLSRQEVLKRKDWFGDFVWRVEKLLQQYDEPRFDKYKYISSMPSSIYKSLQKLVLEELLRAPMFEELYEDYLRRHQLVPAPEENRRDMGPLHERMEMEIMSLMPIMIEPKRAELKRDVAQILKRTDSHYTVNDVLLHIYDSGHGSEDFHKLFTMIGPNHNEVDFQEAVRILQDTWNFFPHRLNNGLSPIELIIQSRGKKI